MVLLKFFRWLHDQDNPDIKNRKFPDCMKGVKRLRRKEVSRYKPVDQKESYYPTTAYLDTQTFKITDDELSTRRQ